MCDVQLENQVTNSRFCKREREREKNRQYRGDCRHVLQLGCTDHVQSRNL